MREGGKLQYTNPLNYLIMKNFFSFSLLICLLLFLTPFNANAQEKKGSTYSVSENSNCASGYMHRCTGTGSTCYLTIGWDCTQHQQ